jgi:hypothetical protein
MPIKARHHIGQTCFQLAARPPLPQHDRPTSIQANDMERVLPDIDPDDRDRGLRCLGHERAPYRYRLSA